MPTYDRLLEVRTPYGRPVAWAEVAMVSDIGDSHELNDDRCLVIASRELGRRRSGSTDEYLLCVLADGATGSTFASQPAKAAGWRASQLAQAAFVERFLESAEVDVLDQLKDALRAADRALVESREGTLSTTLTALYLAADGSACAASIGDSVLVVLPPGRKTPAERRLKKLGYEDTTAVGSGDTTLSYVDESELIEQWWPNKEGGHADMHVKPGTYFVLMSDGMSDNLPIDFVDQLLHRHTLESATVGLPRHTRERRADMQRHGGGSITQLGLDNMSAIVVRFDGEQHAAPRAAAPRAPDARLVTVQGTFGGPTPDAGGQFGMVALASNDSAGALPAFLRSWLESEHSGESERLRAAFERRGAAPPETRFAALARGPQTGTDTFALGLPAVATLLDVGIGDRTVAVARDSVWQQFVYSPRVWASTVATLAVFLLVSTAFATGTVRPAPPRAPTPMPGEPTPTPDTRPQLSLGGLQLVAPALPVLPTAVPVEVGGVQSQPTAEPVDDAPAPAPPVRSNPAVPRAPPTVPQPRQPPPAPACTNFFGIGCPAAPAEPDDAPVVPVASPAALLPRSNNKLDDALQVASIADQRFERALTLRPEPTATPVLAASQP